MKLPEDVRDHVGAGNARARITRQLKRSITPSFVTIGATLLALAAGTFMVLRIDRTALVSSQRLTFAVDDAAGVVPKVDEVRFRGIPAGKIDKVELRDGEPVITVSLERRYGTVYRDARATLRPNTPLQDMYLNIVDRGTPGAGKASADQPISGSQTDSSVSVSSVLDVFQGDTRARLAHLLDDLGNGLQDRGASLRVAFADLLPFVKVAGDITRQLDADAPLTKRLIHNTAVLTTTLGDRETSLRRVVNQGAATLATLQQGSGDLDSTLAELPGTLRAANGSFTAVRGVIGDVDRALADLTPVTARLPASLASVRELTGAATPAVEKLRAPVRRLVPLSAALRPTSAALGRSVTRLRPQVPALAHTVGAVAGCLPELAGFFKWDASMAKFGDVLGPAPRGNVVEGLQAVGGKNPFEFLAPSCAPGETIRGRPVQESDKR
jgi:ABC-type transporter Mla subunit MlaD